MLPMIILKRLIITITDAMYPCKRNPDLMFLIRCVGGVLVVKRENPSVRGVSLANPA